jgi:hypothetical protein
MPAPYSLALLTRSRQRVAKADGLELPAFPFLKPGEAPAVLPRPASVRNNHLSAQARFRSIVSIVFQRSGPIVLGIEV